MSSTKRRHRKYVRNILVLFDIPPKMAGVKLPWRDRVIVAVRRRYNRNDF